MKIAYNAYCLFFAFAFDYCVFFEFLYFFFSMLPFLVNEDVYIYSFQVTL